MTGVDQAAFGVQDISNVLADKLIPTVTVHNRLEGRPRTMAFDRALRAELRDPLWMLTRQWQVGEFEGDDAGSPVQAKLAVERTELRHYRAREGTVTPFDDALPLEAQVERRPVRLRAGDRPMSLDLRVLAGRRWLRLVADLPTDYRQQFLDAYPVEAPDPALAADADQVAHPETWQTVAAFAGRSMDGGALYLHLRAGGRPYDELPGVSGTDEAALDERATRFLVWFAQLLPSPATDGEDAWDPNRLEYRFSCSAPEREGETVYTAEQYHGGHLDWWAFDVDPDAAPLGTDTLPDQPPVCTIIPTPVSFAGMPNTRWWAFEDNRVNLGDVDAATTDVAKLLFLEFAVVYANDWFLVPLALPTGSVTRVRGLAVTTVFGERVWIDPAGAGPDDDWQRWSMFNVSVRGQHGEPADTRLLLPPTVPKIQESEPLEEVLLIRDEMANMVWGVERVVPMPTGDSRAGGEAARETLEVFTRLAGTSQTDPSEPVASVRYEMMSSVPEHWIPFIPVHVEGDNREVQLQRAGLPRAVSGAPAKVRPRTSLLRHGLDDATPAAYLIPEEEVPRSGTRITQTFQRTRWHGGRTVTWLGVRRTAGRGEGSSGLAFDRVIDTPKQS
ncbi:hypothetical protein AB0K14_19465 [Actinosynnema sp. NPDC050801]|uniref:hypothetical protein n=1 Tax=unclassified Actinosynnema TaxID=2637065 RepID=UPI0033C244EB